MGSFSLWHWLVVLLIVVLIFGTKKLKNMGGDVGGAVNEFKKAMKGSQSEDKSAAAALPVEKVAKAKPKAKTTKPASKAKTKAAVVAKPKASTKPSKAKTKPQV